MPSAPAVRDAATVVLLREATADEGPEVLLLRRHSRSGFAASMWVFPGGTVDPADRRMDASSYRLDDPDGRALACGLALGRTLGLHVAAARETFEEAGVLLAHDRAGVVADVTEPDVTMMRHALNERGARRSAHAPDAPARGVDFHGWVGQRGLVLDLEALVPFARWVTPAAEPRRYDTLFLLAQAPSSQVAAADEVETTGARWTTPAAALAAHRRGELDLIFPTVKNLEWLAAHASVRAALDGARELVAAQPLRVIEPHMEVDQDRRVTGLWHPDDPAFPWDRYQGLSVPR